MNVRGDFIVYMMLRNELRMISDAAESDDKQQVPVAHKGLAESYRSGRDDLGRDFFSPCLRSCVRYRRAASFFSSGALRAWATALPRLVRANHSPEGAATIQLLAAPVLGKDDLAAMLVTLLMPTPEQAGGS